MEYDHEVVVHAPPEYVYDIVAEPQDYAPVDVVPELVKETPGRTRCGTRWHEAVRLGPGLTLRTRTVATQVDPSERLTMQWTGPWMHGETTYTLRACADGTCFRQQETMVPEGPLRIVGRWVGGSLATRLTARMEDIRDLAEGLVVAAAQPSTPSTDKNRA